MRLRAGFSTRFLESSRLVPMRFRFAVLLSALVAASVVGACSNEGEGQICDHRAGNNGNDDCQNGLICTQNLPGVNGDRCCPPDRSTATTPECALTTPGIGDASSALPDGTTPVADAAGDAPSEAAARGDAAPDALADAGATTDASDAAGQ